MSIFSTILSWKGVFRNIAIIYAIYILTKFVKYYTTGRHTPRLKGGPGHADPQASSLFRKRYLKNKQGLWIFLEEWIPDSKKPLRGVCFVTHGLGEYCQRYAHLGAALNELGIAVFSLDHQGMGRSEGDRLYVERFQDYIDDYCQYVDHIMKSGRKINGKALDSVPLFMFGHSLGSLIALRTVEDCKQRGYNFTGVVISGLALQEDPMMNTPVAVSFLRTLGAIVPKVPVKFLDVSGVVDDDIALAHYLNDPLIIKKGIPARLAAEALICQQHVMKSLFPNLKEPILMLHGTEDTVCVPASSREMYEVCPSKDKTLKMYENCKHEVLNSVHRDKVMSDLISWVDERLPSEDKH